MAAFIAAQRADHGIPHAVSCRALGVSEGWFFKWKDGDHSARRARRERLKAEVARLFEAHKGKRGSPMITADLRDAGWRVSKTTVAAVMAEMGLAARAGVAAWIEDYNHHSRHSSLGRVSPVEYERSLAGKDAA